MTTPAAKKTCALIILDGWGYREDGDSNAIEAATTPVWDQLWTSAPHSLISASGEDVGLPDGQMGNSEVGHMSLGAGRIVYQSITRIDKALEDGSFFDNATLLDFIDKLKASGGTAHLMGLASDGGQFLVLGRRIRLRQIRVAQLDVDISSRPPPPFLHAEEAEEQHRAEEKRVQHGNQGREEQVDPSFVRGLISTDRPEIAKRTQAAQDKQVTNIEEVE